MSNNYFKKDRLIMKTDKNNEESILSLELFNENVLEYYDMPVLFFLSGNIISYIGYWIKSEKEYDQFFLIDSTKSQLEAYKDNRIDLKTFLSGTNCILLERNYKDQKDILSDIDMSFYKKIISNIHSGIKHTN